MQPLDDEVAATSATHNVQRRARKGRSRRFDAGDVAAEETFTGNSQLEPNRDVGITMSK
jgi:hypothetical protein